MNAYVEAAGRHGITPHAARTIVRTNSTVIAALSVRLGQADAMICGLEGRYMAHLNKIRDMIGLRQGVREFAALSLVITGKGAYFLADTQVTPDPTAEEIAEMAVLAAAHVRRFGIDAQDRAAVALRFRLLRQRIRPQNAACGRASGASHPDLEVDGEMHGDAALSQTEREKVFPHSRLKGEANVLIMPNLDAANIAYQMTKVLADALAVGTDFVGAACPAHILTPSVTARGVINMTAIAVVEAQACA